MFKFLYTNTASLPDKMHELRANVADSASDVLMVTETWVRRGAIHAELAVSGYMHLKKGNAEGRKGSVVAKMFKSNILAVHHPLV